MNSLTSWIRQNKVLALVLLLGVGYLGYVNFFPHYRTMNQSMMMDRASVAPSYGGAESGMMVEPMMAGRGIMPPIYPEDSVSLDQEDRMVVTDSYFSVLVSDVKVAIDTIKSQAQAVGGFVVNSSVNQPTETSTGTLVVRVPNDQVDTVAQTIRESAIRVTMETVSGYDVTDQYTDFQARLETLEATLDKFQAMFDRATEVSDTLEVQRAIIQTQDQIDHVVGRLEYLEQVSQSSKITVNLATDELALPYMPDEAWRPQLVFKTAVRSLVTNIRNFGSFLIWVGVYSPVIVVAGGGYLLGRKVMRQRQ